MKLVISNLKNKIYTILSVQVMLDSELSVYTTQKQNI